MSVVAGFDAPTKEPATGGDVVRGQTYSEALEKGFERAEVWDAVLDPSEQHCIDLIVQTWPEAAQQVIDMGAGDARVSRHLPSQLSVLKVDLNAAAIERAPPPKMVADITALPFPDHAFDVAMCSNVLEHLTNDTMRAAMSEARRVAKSHILIVGPLAEDIEAAQTRCDQCGTKFHPNGHIQSLSVQDVAGELAPEFVLVERAVTPHVWRTVDPVTQSLELALGADPFAWPHAVCPACATMSRPYGARPTPAVVSRARRLIEPKVREPKPLEVVLWFERARLRSRIRRSDGLHIRPLEPSTAQVTLEQRDTGFAFPDQTSAEQPAAMRTGAFLTADPTHWGPLRVYADGIARRELAGPEAFVLLPLHQLVRRRRVALDYLDQGVGTVHVSIYDGLGHWCALGEIALSGSGEARVARFDVPLPWTAPMATPILAVRASAGLNITRPAFGPIGAGDAPFAGPARVVAVPPTGVVLPPAETVRERDVDWVLKSDGAGVLVRDIRRDVSTYWGQGAFVASPPQEPWESDPVQPDGQRALEAIVTVGTAALLEGEAAQVDAKPVETWRAILSRLDETPLATSHGGIQALRTSLRDWIDQTDVWLLQNKDLSSRVQALEADSQKLQAENSRLAEAFALAEAQATRVQALEADSQKLQAENSRLAEAFALSKAQATQIELLTSQVLALQAVAKSLEEIAGSAQKQLMDAIAKNGTLKAAIATADAGLEVARLKEMRLQAELQTAWRSLSEHKESVCSLQAQVERLHAHTNALEAARAAAESAAQAAHRQREDAERTLERVAAGAAQAAKRRDALAAALLAAKKSPVGIFIKMPPDSR